MPGCDGVCAKKLSGRRGEQGALRRAGWEVGLPCSRALTVRGMGQKNSNIRKRNAKGHFIKQDKSEEKIANEAAEQETQETKPTESKPPDEDADKNKSPKAKVRAAQMVVIDKVKKIMEGNCASATQGNYKCAEFVLDWSGASDIRTPLSKETKRSLIATLLKQAKMQEKAKKEETDEE